MSLFLAMCSHEILYHLVWKLNLYDIEKELRMNVWSFHVICMNRFEYELVPFPCLKVGILSTE